MKSMTQAQVNALDRILDLLEEQSFVTVEKHDESFRAFVNKLYGQVSTRATRLENRMTAGV